MLPSPLVPGSLEAFIVELGKILRDNRKEAYTSYFGLFNSSSVVFKRKRPRGYHQVRAQPNYGCASERELARRSGLPIVRGDNSGDWIEDFDFQCPMER